MAVPWPRGRKGSRLVPVLIVGIVVVNRAGAQRPQAFLLLKRAATEWQRQQLAGLARGRGRAAKFRGLLVHINARVCSFIFLSQLALLSLCSYQGTRHRYPLRKRVPGWVSTESLHPVLVAYVAPQRSDYFGNNLALPPVPEIRQGSTGAGTQLLKRRDNNVEGDRKGGRKRK